MNFDSKMQVTSSRVGGIILPRQIQRVLPICLVFFFFIMVFSKGDTMGSTGVLRHFMPGQGPLQPRLEQFPNKIWQLWKIDGMNLDAREAVRARSWTSKNPGHRYEMLTDGNGLRYVETNFGPNGLNRPDIVYMYRHLTATIIQADLLRYLVMYIEGGIYADVDVEALQPIDKFIPPPFLEKDIDFVIGVEIDEPDWANHTILGPKSRSFCQWTFMTKPRLPVMMRLIDNIIDWLNEMSRVQNVPVSELKLNFDEVITGTGPSAFTTAVLAEMKAQTGRDWSWDEFHGIQEPKQVGNTLVLTVYGFAAGQGHSNSSNHDHPYAVVRHHYHASLWPDRHPRYSHPAFGMVEECNWNKECVHAWDANTTRYKTLPENEQNVLIEIKKKADAEKFDQETAEHEQQQREDEERRNAEFRAQCDAAAGKENPTPEGAAPQEGQPAEGGNPAEQPPPPPPAADGAPANPPPVEGQPNPPPAGEAPGSQAAIAGGAPAAPEQPKAEGATPEPKEEEVKTPKHHPQSPAAQQPAPMQGMTKK